MSERRFELLGYGCWFGVRYAPDRYIRLFRFRGDLAGGQPNLLERLARRVAGYPPRRRFSRQ